LLILGLFADLQERKFLEAVEADLQGRSDWSLAVLDNVSLPFLLKPRSPSLPEPSCPPQRLSLPLSSSTLTLLLSLARSLSGALTLTTHNHAQTQHTHTHVHRYIHIHTHTCTPHSGVGGDRVNVDCDGALSRYARLCCCQQGMPYTQNPELNPKHALQMNLEVKHRGIINQ
jgi:hypothetical protein